ncbi:hypothetical protein BEWA_023910 [Theileria equi strain WA]|uniref:Uncharacterized protein n=1 Tax=Theileria equi strain WA TaxID=1537102 RepID=L0AVA4_THEEQ|nr:hypothetical protein BEWA_023910 [Theileria equi strain WA]AFZ79542.1 hypothetical protein BEWA_023910 [Theileria equi strain WA]|eukprot:XP_004829208.1 hypothetical protein BEWA_023910 [Theileria equi strain WA]
MLRDVNVHILPCLIEYNGKTDVRERFEKRINSLKEEDSNPDAIDGNRTIKDICGEVVDAANFDVKVTEQCVGDVYASMNKIDDFLKKDRFNTLFRGRELRGKEVNLEKMGYSMSVVSSSESQRVHDFLKNEGISCKKLTKTANIDPVTIWDLETDISPNNQNLVGYKYLLISPSIADYSGEQEYVNSHLKT